MKPLITGAIFLFGAVAFSFANAPMSPTLQVLFAGDLMLDRTVSSHAGMYGSRSLYAGVEDLFSQADVRVVNLEGTITDQESIAEIDHSILRFTFDIQLSRDVLAGLGINAVSLANNHSGDFGVDGYSQTKRQLQLNHVRSFGSYNNLSDLTTAIPTKLGYVCIIGYEQFINPSVDPIVAEILKSRQDCFKTIVFAHWGEEYAPLANTLQQSAGRAFIDAGADLVIGAHPHVVEPYEIYKGRPIFYSLGNFIFDQDFSYATMHALALGVTFSNTDTMFTLTPLVLGHSEVSIDGLASTTSFVLANTTQ